jgi:hypothetical protein
MKRLFPALFLLTFGILFAFMIPGLTSASAQKEAPRSVSGIVSDELTGEPLPGVKVYCENSHAETYTDFDGMFSIPAQSTENASLVFKYISYQDMRLDDVKLTEEPLQVCLKQ